MAHAFGRHLGPGISGRVAEFIGTAEPGARLTLQKSKDGFTLQITGEVVRDDQPDEIRLTGLAGMSKALNDEGDGPEREPGNGPANETLGQNHGGGHGAAPRGRPSTNGRGEST